MRCSCVQAAVLDTRCAWQMSPSVVETPNIVTYSRWPIIPHPVPITYSPSRLLCVREGLHSGSRIRVRQVSRGISAHDRSPRDHCPGSSGRHVRLCMALPHVASATERREKPARLAEVHRAHLSGRPFSSDQDYHCHLADRHRGSVASVVILAIHTSMILGAEQTQLDLTEGASYYHSDIG